MSPRSVLMLGARVGQPSMLCRVGYPTADRQLTLRRVALCVGTGALSSGTVLRVLVDTSTGLDVRSVEKVKSSSSPSANWSEREPYSSWCRK